MGITVTGGVHFFFCMFGVLGNYSYLCTGLRNTAFRMATEFKSHNNGIIPTLSPIRLDAFPVSLCSFRAPSLPSTHKHQERAIQTDSDAL